MSLKRRLPQELPDDQKGPALVEQFGRFRDGTELAVTLHAAHLRTLRARLPLQHLYWLATPSVLETTPGPPPS